MTITIAVRPAVTPNRRTSPPPVRVRPVPPLEPATDDGTPTGAPPAPVLPFGAEVGPMPLAPLLVPMTDSDEEARASATLAARRFLGASLEVIGGYRPATHLRALCAPGCFVGVARALTGRTAAGAGGTTPLNARVPVARDRQPGRQTAPADRVTVRRIQVGAPMEGVAEVAVVLARDDAVWAMAMRFELHHNRWLCSYLHVL